MTTPTTPAADAVSAIQALIDDEAQYLCVVVAKTHLALLLSEIAAATARESALIAERDALRAQAATLESIHKIIECAGPEAADEIADLLGYPSVEWPSDQAASVPVIAGVGEPLRDAVLGAVARGWCHESTKHLEMDAELAHAITAEVMAALQASRHPQAQQGVAAPLELKVCHSQNASQTPQTDLSLMAAPQEWSPAYTRGPARQSAPVAAVPAMVQLTEEQMVSAVRPLCNTDQVAERLVAVSIDEYRAIEAASAKLNGLTVGDGTAKAQPFDIRND